MANIASARKRARKSVASAERNKVRRSNMRSRVRRVEEAIAAGNVDEATQSLRTMESALAQAGRTNLIHPKTASRKVARMHAKVKALATAGSAPEEPQAVAPSPPPQEATPQETAPQVAPPAPAEAPAEASPPEQPAAAKVKKRKWLW